MSLRHALDELTADFVTFLCDSHPAAAALLGDVRGLGAIGPRMDLEGRRAEGDRLISRLSALGPADELEQVAIRVLRARIQWVEVNEELNIPWSRPDSPLEWAAEALHLIVGWPELSPVDKNSHLSCWQLEVEALLRSLLRSSTDADPARPLVPLYVEHALDACEDLRSFYLAAVGPLPERLRLALDDAEVELTRRRTDEATATVLGLTGFARGESALRRWLVEIEGVETPIEALFALGLERLNLERQTLETLCIAVDPRGTTSEVLKRLNDDLPTAAELVPEARRFVSLLRDFVLGAELLSLPETTPCVVRPAPDYLCALSAACLDTHGPLLPDALEACYYLAVPKDAEAHGLSRTRLAWVTAHETYPGHLAQALHARRVSVPVFALADSECFIEGWAHYAEGLLSEHGFQGGGLELDIGVAWGRVLRRVRMVAALSLHARGATLDEATDLFVRHAFLPLDEARIEARRAATDPTVLAYALGRDQIEDAKAKARLVLGSAFDLCAFHDELLSWGNVPIPFRTARARTRLT